jgi:hypothetical protein
MLVHLLVEYLLGRANDFDDGWKVHVFGLALGQLLHLPPAGVTEFVAQL